MNCPICGQENVDNAPKCIRCNFEELHKEFSNKDEHIKWLQQTAIPYAAQYVLSIMSPMEARRLRLVLGLEDGIKHTDEEVAKKEDVCVNRIYQHKAKLLRLINRQPCVIKVKELKEAKGE